MKILAVILLVLILAAAGLTFYVYRSKAMFLPALLGLGRFPQVKKESYYNGDGTFRQATADDSMAFLMQHPVFGGYKHMFFNAEDNVLKSIAPASYSAFMKAQGREEQLESSLESFNYLTAQVQQGRAWLLSDLYPEEDVEKDPYKSHLAGMFYQGEEGKPLAIVVPGGGFISNVTDCEGYPVAMELHRRGYSVLVLSYPIGKQLGQTEQVKQAEQACRELVQAVRYLNDHQEQLNINMEDFAIFGFSAGGMMTTSYAFAHYADSCHKHELPRPTAIFPIYGLDWNVEPLPMDRGLAVFSVVGREDPYGFGMIEEKIPALTETLGEENVSIRVYDHLGHGFGLGTETVAKNWLQEAVDFWEAHR